MAELVHQTWTRVTGKPWSAAAAGGFTTGTAQANLALQAKLNTGWNPYGAAPAAAPAPAPAAAPGLSSYQTAADANTTALMNQQAALKTEQTGLLGDYNKFIDTSPKMADLARQYSTEAGIPQLQAQLEPVRLETLNTEELLSKVSGDVTSRVQRAGGTEFDRRLLEGSKRNPLVEQLGSLARTQERFAGQIAVASEGVKTLLGYADNQFQKELSKYTQALSSFDVRAARESSTYSQAKSDELSATFKAIDRANQLNDQEAERAFTLLRDANAFKNDLISNAQKASSSGTSSSKRQQDVFLSNFKNLVSKGNENAIWQYLRSSETGGSGGANIAESLGLDPAVFWRQWEAVKAGKPSSGVAGAPPS